MDDGEPWSLSPAYDLTYAPGPGGEHTMTVLGEGRNPIREQCVDLARQFGIREKDTRGIIDEVNEAVGRWLSLRTRRGVRSRRGVRLAGG